VVYKNDITQHNCSPSQVGHNTSDDCFHNNIRRARVRVYTRTRNRTDCNIFVISKKILHNCPFFVKPKNVSHFYSARDVPAARPVATFRRRRATARVFGLLVTVFAIRNILTAWECHRDWTVYDCRLFLKSVRRVFDRSGIFHATIIHSLLPPPSLCFVLERIEFWRVSKQSVTFKYNNTQFTRKIPKIENKTNRQPAKRSLTFVKLTYLCASINHRSLLYNIQY